MGGATFATTLTLLFLAAWAASMLATQIIGGLIDALSPAAATAAALEYISAIILRLITLVFTTGFAFVLVSKARSTAGLPEVAPEQRTARSRLRSRRTVVRLVALAALCGVGAYATSSAPATAAMGANSIVISHRGYDTDGVENTIEALDAAAAYEPDFVEVDIQQTADGGFIASHDVNLFVLAGVNKNIYDMTTDEVTSTTVRMKGNAAKIPTMADYVDRARGLGVPLMIELKVTGHEHPGFVADLLKELDQHSALHNNIFHSLNAAAVEEIKRLYPDLRVGLTIGMLYGRLPSAVTCDFYTVEQASFTPELVQAAHRLDREVYVWTVNDALAMRRFLRAGADGLVTDRLGPADRFRARTTSRGGYVQGDARDLMLRGDIWREGAGAG